MRLPPAAALPALLLALAALAGCAEDAPAPAVGPEPERTSEAGADEPMVQVSDFGWLAAGGVAGNDAQAMSSNAASYDVRKDAVHLVANVTWTCLSPTCELHAYLCSPEESPLPPPFGDGCTGHAFGPSPLTLSVEDPVAGEWRVSLHSDSATADVSGTITIEQHLGAKGGAAA